MARASAIALALLILLVLSAPLVVGARLCFRANTVCAEYNTAFGDTYVDLESDAFVAGAGQHRLGDFVGVNAYFFAPAAHAGVYEGRYQERDITLVTVGTADAELVFFHMDERATRAPTAYNCLTIGTTMGPLYARCGRGLA